MALQPQTPSTALETGDRFDVDLSPDGRTLTLPECFLDLDQVIDELLGPDAGPITFKMADSLSDLELDDPPGPLPAGTDSLWLEYQKPGRFQLLVRNNEP